MSISKEEAVKLLTKKGYRAEDDRGVIYLTAVNGKPTLKEFQNVLKEIDYDMSYGYRQEGANMHVQDKKQESVEKLEELEAEPDERLDKAPVFDADDEGQMSFSF